MHDRDDVASDGFAAIFRRAEEGNGRRFQLSKRFERYDENFDSLTGSGGPEIWVPIRE